jgi:hypothetical protein
MLGLAILDLATNAKKFGALSRASTGLKTFAQTLVTDHSAAVSQASALAKQIGLVRPPSQHLKMAKSLASPERNDAAGSLIRFSPARRPAVVDALSGTRACCVPAGSGEEKR